MEGQLVLFSCTQGKRARKTHVFLIQENMWCAAQRNLLLPTEHVVSGGEQSIWLASFERNEKYNEKLFTHGLYYATCTYLYHSKALFLKTLCRFPSIDQKYGNQLCLHWVLLPPSLLWRSTWMLQWLQWWMLSLGASLYFISFCDDCKNFMFVKTSVAFNALLFSCFGSRKGEM